MLGEILDGGRFAKRLRYCHFIACGVEGGSLVEVLHSVVQIFQVLGDECGWAFPRIKT